MREQLFTVLFCLLHGIMSGILYAVCSLLRSIFKRKAAIFAVDILFFLLSAALFLFLSVRFQLAEFRLYMLALSLVGLFLYEKSIGKSVAFFVGFVYNKTKVLFSGKFARRFSWKKRKKQTGSQSAQP